MNTFAEEKALLKNDVVKMGMQVVDMLSYAMDILDHAEDKDRDAMKIRYRKVQEQQNRNEEKVAEIAAEFTSEKEEIRDIIAAVRISVHFERIAARSLHIAYTRSPEAIRELRDDFHKLKKMIGKCMDFFIVVMEAYKSEDKKAAKKNLYKDLEIMSAYQRFNIRVCASIKKRPENIDSYIKLINLNRDIERLATHIMHISTWIYFLITGERIIPDSYPE